MPSETKKFTVDDITYEASYDTESHGFMFCVLQLESRRVTYDEDEAAWNWFEPLPERTSWSSELLETKKPIAVYRNVMAFVTTMLRKHRPYYFTYLANEEEKMGRYALTAARLGRTFGYLVEQDGRSFRFYRMHVEEA
ncbi:hypothetical protein Rumeso_04401 [Rubellimicrobium mesophilum DSM 19309]|uniref:Uncharacterized protein n=2 Tax=Rubellimicrobium TaxID=295418 RepID=A0A017HI96_9RHOB|nr:hypothetical protein Rumeso_04401 [Rubellimicrobium mesophilum DSM 19309]